MKKLIIKFYKQNKKTTLITIISITSVLTLLLTVLLLLCSTHSYLVKQTKPDYHVKIKTQNFEKNTNYKNISKINFKNNEIQITYTNITSTYKDTKQLCKKIKCEKITYNQKLLKLYGMNKNTTQKFLKIIISVIILFALSSILIIKSSFSISYTLRKKYFSILKSLGATKYQIYKITIIECLITTIISLSIALIISLSLNQIIITIINTHLKELLVIDLKQTIYPKIALITIIYIIIIIFISAIIPLPKILNTQVITQIRNSEEIKKKKTPQYLKDILKIIAYSNYKRIKKRYRPITIAIFISTLLYVTTTLYLNYGLKVLESKNIIPEYDGMIVAESEKGLKILGDKASSNNYKKYSLFRMCAIEIKDNKSFYINKKDYKKKKNLIIIGSTSEGVINKQKYNKTTETSPYLKSFKIKDKQIKLLNKIPWGTEDLLKENNIVMLTDNLDNYCQSYSVILKYQGNTQNIGKEAATLSKKYNIPIKYVDASKAKHLTKSTITIIKICLYGLLALIIIIIIQFIINILISSLDQRKQEFKILKSIGIENQQIKKILIYESILITKKGFILGIIISSLFNYALYISLKEITNISLIIPFKQYIISLLILNLIIYLILNHKIKGSK